MPFSLPLQHQSTGKMVKRWTVGQSHFPVVRRVPRVRPRVFPKARKTMKKVFNRNTHLGVNVKTMLRSENVMKTGKDYQGVLRRDVECDEFHWDEHFTFVETLSWSMKRNPRVFNGKFISVTRQDDGSLRPNFKPMKVGEDFSVERYALGVYNELCMALEGLVEEESVTE